MIGKGLDRTLLNDNHHETKLFPAISNLDCTFTAGGTPDVFGLWTEIVDNAGVPNKLSDAFSSKGGYISSVIAETGTIADKIYLIEIAYGTLKIPIARVRFLKANIAQNRIRTPKIPKGEKVYYRMMCETGSASCTMHIRYYLEM